MFAAIEFGLDDVSSSVWKPLPGERTMATAIVSLVRGVKVWPEVAMTGEISLRGLVLPVGGIKEKIIAADAAGLKRVMLPARNRRDEGDIPAEVRERLQFIWLENVDDAIAAALEPPRSAAGG